MKILLTSIIVCAFTITQAQTSKVDSFKIKLDKHIVDFKQPYNQSYAKWNQPLYILNGKRMQNDSLLLTNPDLIQSIEVLKGQKAELAYGEAGKNGVLIITLKEKIRKEED